jgi:hypothetical protein
MPNTVLVVVKPVSALGSEIREIAKPDPATIPLNGGFIKEYRRSARVPKLRNAGAVPDEPCRRIPGYLSLHRYSRNEMRRSRNCSERLRHARAWKPLLTGLGVLGPRRNHSQEIPPLDTYRSSKATPAFLISGTGSPRDIMRFTGYSARDLGPSRCRSAHYEHNRRRQQRPCP